MTLRTARRRITPRTKRRYLAIRNFFRKTLGSIASQPDIKTNSSIELNVTDLQHKIVGFEEHLNEVSQQCLNYPSFESISKRDLESLIPTEGNQGNTSTSLIERGTPTDKKAVERDTKVLYDIEGDHQLKSDYTGIGELYNDSGDRNSHNSEIMNYEAGASNQHARRIRSKKNRHNAYCDEFSRSNAKLRNHRIHYPNLENSNLVADSYHSLATASATRYTRPNDFIQRRGRKQSCHQNYTRAPSPDLARTKRREDKPKHDKSASPPRAQEDIRERGKKKKTDNSLDQDFIADIIKRQYRPVKLFGRRESDLSQMSTPVCRDVEHPARNDVVHDCELCSCCVPGRGASRAHRAQSRAGDVSDMRSLCDTRLYSSRRRMRSRHRKEQVDIYNDSSLYDVVPVKEKTSPMSRRKFVEDHMAHYENLKEVLPSPRSQRPRLNLQAQNYDYESTMVRDKPSRRRRSPHQPMRQEYVDTFAFRSEVSSEESGQKEYIKIQPQPVKTTRNAQVQEDMGLTKGLLYPEFTDDNTNTDVNDSLNQTDDNDEKTDKALCEIKDILQNFLLEIKKDSSVSQSEHSSEMINNTNGIKQSDEYQSNCRIETPNGLQNNGFIDFSNCGLGQCSLPGMQPGLPPPAMPAPGVPLPGMPSPGMPSPGIPPSTIPSPYIPPPYMTNPCCYPLLCSMNGLQNGYLMSNPSFTCHGCGNSSKDCDVRHAGCSPKENVPCEANTTKKSSETENLIREIYKYVAQNSNTRKPSPVSSQLNSPREPGVAEKILTSRSVGQSHRYPSKHDANVGTPLLLVSSKSCEAVGSRVNSDAFYMHTNVSFSDTVLEKLTTETPVQSTTALDTADSSEKRTRSKFASVLQTIGLIKKRAKIKKDAIEEISESESTTDVNARQRHPYRQNVTNYMMHDQEYYRSPPSPPELRQHFPRDSSPHYDYGYTPYDSFPNPGQSPSRMADMYDPYRERRDPSPPGARIHPKASAPPYPHPYEQQCNPHMQPQVPLCLKEIEVKSAGTQSERKMSFFHKLSQKTQPPPTPSATRDHPQTTNFTQTSKPSKPGLWNQLQAKAAAAKYPDAEPFPFGFKSQKTVPDGDKVRKAMIKKLFYKRNPFSPRNLIVRTLLGKDKSSFGMPPSNMMYRPRMFI